MGCHHGYGYHRHGCWGPGECHGEGWGWEGASGPAYGPAYATGYGRGPGYGYRGRVAGRYGAASRSAGPPSSRRTWPTCGMRFAPSRPIWPRWPAPNPRALGTAGLNRSAI